MSNLGRSLLGIAVAYTLFADASAGLAQTSVAGAEFITSSSPLSNGTVVTTTYYPKSGTAPVTSLSAAYGGVPIVASLPTIPARTEQSVLQGTTSTNNAVSSFRPAATLPTAGLAVPPNMTQPATVQMPTWGSPYAGPTPYLANPSTTQVGRYPYPQSTVLDLPQGTVYPYPVASTVPTLNGIPNLPPPPVPYVAQRTPYTPLIRYQNMPPGTYLGQGWVGQPKAYVDGQPVRNLLRYVFP